MNIILCGPPFTGKTTYGKIVSEKLNRPFLDTDRELEKIYFQKYGEALSCRLIYKNYGDQFYREIENEMMITIKVEKKVIALGGGVLLNPINHRLVKDLGCLIYIETPISSLLERLKNSPMPAYLEKAKDPVEEYRQIVIKRDSIYKLYADLHIRTDTYSENEMIVKICECFNG